MPIVYYDGKLIRKRQPDIFLIERFLEDGDVQELHRLSQNLGSQASMAVLGCFLTTRLDEPSCSDQFSNPERFQTFALVNEQELLSAI
jgi:hypothetical protein